jgi:predicted nucleic acid-binding protein
VRIFFDTNVVLDGYYQRAGAQASERAFLLCQAGTHTGWIAWHTLSNAYYLVRGHSKSTATALQFVADLLSWTEMASTSRADALSATISGTRDFEDALQMVAAVACGADVILTRNLADFKSSPITAMTPEIFLLSLGLTP